MDIDRNFTRNALGHNKYFDLMAAGLGATFMGGAVYAANLKYGLDAALTPALKQAAYTFCMGGLVTRVCENLAVGIRNKNFAIASSVIIPSVFTIGLTYLLHSLRGTPEALESTIPTMIVAPLGTLFWGNRKRKQLEIIAQD